MHLVIFDLLGLGIASESEKEAAWLDRLDTRKYENTEPPCKLLFINLLSLPWRLWCAFSSWLLPRVKLGLDFLFIPFLLSFRFAASREDWLSLPAGVPPSRSPWREKLWCDSLQAAHAAAEGGQQEAQLRCSTGSLLKRGSTTQASQMMSFPQCRVMIGKSFLSRSA